jgi:uncharacterized protein YecE (DUF72 family)
VIRVGPAGWSYPDWEGRVYPERKPRGFHPLPYLSRFVSCLEINSSFYAYPRAEHAQRWVALLEGHEDFRLLAKLHRDFTHGLLPGREAAREFLAGVEPLCAADLLAALLVQFPFSFRRDAQAVERLAVIAELFEGLPLVLEVRHRSWFETEAIAEIAALGYSLAHVDLPSARDHPPDWHAPTGRLGYLRLHGRNAEQWFRSGAGRDDRYDYLYAEPEVTALVEKARRLAGEHDETYVVTNNHFAGKAVANALEIQSLLAGAPVPAPACLVAAYPRLAPRVQVEGPGECQGELF